MMLYPTDPVVFVQVIDPWHERDLLNEIGVPVEHPGTVMLGELAVGERSRNHRECLGPSLSQLFEEAGDRDGRE